MKESENKDSENFELAKAIAEQIKIKNKAQNRNNYLKKKLGQFIEELYNDIKKKIEDLSKESKELETKQQSGEELTKIEKDRILELKRELIILGEELKFLEREIRKLRQEVEKLIGDGPSEKKKGPKKVDPTSETREGETPVTPESESPAAPEGETPVTPEGETPVTPEGETPVTPEGETPVTPEGESPAQQPQVIPVGGGGTVVAPQANSNPNANKGKKGEKEEEHRETEKSKKDPKKERYLKLKDICDRMQMTDEELSKADKKKVTKEEIEELDTEFKKIHISMLKDTDKVDKWDKRILASMLCQDRYYENADKEKRAEYYVETKIKGLWAKFKAAIGKKLPSTIMQQKEMLEKMVDFIQNDKSLETDLSERSQRDDLKNAMTQAILSWNTKIENDMAKCQSALPEASEMSDNLEASVETEIGTEEVPEAHKEEPEVPVV